MLRGLNAYDVDLAGILGTGAAAVVAWSQSKHYASLAEAYAVTSHHVALVEDELDADNEPAWAEAVHDAESAFSREHTLWWARRQG